MSEELEVVFKVANEYIKRVRGEVEELQRQVDRKKEKMEILEMALIVIEENCSDG